MSIKLYFELEKRPAGAFWAEGQIFKSASNLVLMADLESTHNSMKIRQQIVDFRSFCVELWPKQVLHGISVPMSYIKRSVGDGLENLFA